MHLIESAVMKMLLILLKLPMICAEPFRSQYRGEALGTDCAKQNSAGWRPEVTLSAKFVHDHDAPMVTGLQRIFPNTLQPAIRLVLKMCDNAGCKPETRRT